MNISGKVIVNNVYKSNINYNAKIVVGEGMFYICPVCGKPKHRVVSDKEGNVLYCVECYRKKEKKDENN